ncbi:MAG: hypothetical protein AB7D57_05405 [Desulfovibrionaceae bacterium]
MVPAVLAALALLPGAEGPSGGPSGDPRRESVAPPAAGSGPGRCLERAARAFRERDLAAFERYVDVDAVAARAVGDYLDRFYGRPGADGSKVDDGEARLAGDYLAGSLTPRLTRAVADAVRGAVRAGRAGLPGVPETLFNAADCVRGPAGDPGGRFFRGARLARATLDNALVDLDVYHPGLALALTLHLRLARVGGDWRVVELPGVAQAVAAVLVRLGFGLGGDGRP